METIPASPPQTFCKREGKGGCAALPLLGLPNHNAVCFWSSSTAWKSPKPCVSIKATVRVRTEIFFVWYEYALCIHLFLIYSPAPHANQLPTKCQSRSWALRIKFRSLLSYKESRLFSFSAFVNQHLPVRFCHHTLHRTLKSYRVPGWGC